MGEERIVSVGGGYVILSSKKVAEYEEKVENLEWAFVTADHTEFDSVKSFYDYCYQGSVGDSKADFEKGIKARGASCFADKLGLAWIRQIYLPKKGVNCQKNR